METKIETGALLMGDPFVIYVTWRSMWPLNVGNTKLHKETPEFHFARNPDKTFTKDNRDNKDDLLTLALN